MRALDLVATAAALGVFGYFVYKVILPKLGDLQLPSFQLPPPTTQTPQLPQTPSPPTPPAEQPTVDEPESEQPKTDTQPKQQPSTPPPAGAGMTLGFKTTGKKIAMNVGGDPAGTGQRYNTNHAFQNYLMSGLFKLGSGQTLIEMKTDGPNHSGCSQVPRCFWAEPRFGMNGKPSLSMEMPHTPRKDYDISCPSCKSIPGSYAGKWIGYAVAAYGPQGGRIIEQWVDPTGTGTKWQLTLREKIDARWHGAQNRPLPVEGKGLEAEIRMIDASSGSDMKNAFVYEILPPTAGANVGIIRKLMIDEPYLYNGYYNRRRL